MTDLSDYPYQATPGEYQQYFNKDWITTEYHTDCGGAGTADTCPGGTYVVNPSRSCGVMDLGFQSTCIPDVWPTIYKDKCCGADPSVMVNGKFDIAKCANTNNESENRYKGDLITWAPWSKACMNSPTTQAYCSEMDPEKNVSRLISDTKCKSWCMENNQSTDPVVNSMCDVAMTDFCTKYPNQPECLCSHPNTNKYYNNFMEQLKLAKIPAAETANPICWLPICSGSNFNSQIFTKQTVKDKEKCSGTPVNICQQIIDVQKTKGNVIIDKNEFKMLCNKDLPDPTKPPTPTPTPTPIPTPAPTLSEIVKEWIKKNYILFIFIIVGFVGLIGLIFAIRNKK
jgi:hypothetical protein